MKRLFLILLLIVSAVAVFQIRLSYAASFVATQVIADDATGGDCANLGTWDDPSNTCTLTADAEFPSTTGISITGDGITLDCAGFAVNYTSAPNPSVFGVSLNGRANVTIKNCSFSDWGIGVLMNGASNTGHVVDANTFSGSSGLHSAVRALSASHSGLTITNNTISGNMGNVFTVTDAVGVTISDNVSTADQARGLFMTNVTGVNQLSNNTFSCSSSCIEGLVLKESTGFTIDSNVFDGFRDGLYMPGASSNIISNNVIMRSSSNGIELLQNIDAPNSNSTNNTFTNNSIEQTGGLSAVLFAAGANTNTFNGNAVSHSHVFQDDIEDLGTGNVGDNNFCDTVINWADTGEVSGCTFASNTCGNGVQVAAEACDDGNTTNGDGCSEYCQIEPFCGDNSVDPGEVCDDGNTSSGDGCNALCTSTEICGNGFVDVELGEQCDDGNLLEGDGCNSLCQTESSGRSHVRTNTESAQEEVSQPSSVAQDEITEAPDRSEGKVFESDGLLLLPDDLLEEDDIQAQAQVQEQDDEFVGARRVSEQGSVSREVQTAGGVRGAAYIPEDFEEVESSLTLFQALHELFLWSTPSDFQHTNTLDLSKAMIQYALTDKSALMSIGTFLHTRDGVQLVKERQHIRDMAQLMKVMMLMYWDCFNVATQKAVTAIDTEENAFWWRGYWYVFADPLMSILDRDFVPWLPVSDFDVFQVIMNTGELYCQEYLLAVE